ALLDHFRNPRNVGRIQSPDAESFVESPLHGDTLRLTFTLEGERIREARFQCRGCTVAIAAGAAATVLLQGRTLTEALRDTHVDGLQSELGRVARTLGATIGRNGPIHREDVRAILDDVTDERMLCLHFADLTGGTVVAATAPISGARLDPLFQEGFARAAE